MRDVQRRSLLSGHETSLMPRSGRLFQVPVNRSGTHDALIDDGLMGGYLVGGRQLTATEPENIEI